MFNMPPEWRPPTLETLMKLAKGYDGDLKTKTT